MAFRRIRPGCWLLAFVLLIRPGFAQKIIIVRPVVSDEVLMNPGIGFTTFQMFNGDNLPFHDVLNEGNIADYGRNGDPGNKDYPTTSIAYFRINWRFIEPEPGVYHWDFIDSLLTLAHRHGQTLMLRISPYRNEDGIHRGDDVPDWYRKMVGPGTTFVSNKWAVDPEDPRYAKYFGAMIRALGERYDGHPDLETVDVSFLGSAGEGGGAELLTEQTMRNLVDPYVESFKRTRLISLLHGERHIAYMNRNAATPIGWRQDCLGDLGFWAKEQNGWTHMYDYYPETIIEYAMQDAWKTAPISFEICGFFDTWNTREGYSDEQVRYIIDQSLKWHMSSFNGKSSAIPKKWNPLMKDWLNKMGYRFVLRRFSYPAEINRNGKLSFQSWWENKGVAPCYKGYRLAIRLKNDRQERIFITPARVQEWLPGDNVYNDAIFPGSLPEGEYDLQLAIVDDQSADPKVAIAIQGRQSDGWYDLGKLTIGTGKP